MSQTSLPSHTGPMERMTRARSAAVRATKRWMMPAPMSKPSRTTYMASMAATRQNQRAPMVLVRRGAGGAGNFEARLGFAAGTAFDFAIDEEEEKNGEHGIHAGEADEREPDAATGD